MRSVFSVLHTSLLLRFCGICVAFLRSSIFVAVLWPKRRKACCFKFEVGARERERGAHEAFTKGWVVRSWCAFIERWGWKRLCTLFITDQSIPQHLSKSSDFIILPGGLSSLWSIITSIELTFLEYDTWMAIRRSCFTTPLTWRGMTDSLNNQHTDD